MDWSYFYSPAYKLKELLIHLPTYAIKFQSVCITTVFSLKKVRAIEYIPDHNEYKLS